MDHEMALKQMACERYVLGELSELESEEFEEHFFSCRECADDVRAAAALVANMKPVLRTGTTPRLGGLRVPAWRVPSWAFGASMALNAVLVLAVGFVALRLLRDKGLTPGFFQEAEVAGPARSVGAPSSIPCDALCGFTFEVNPDQKFLAYSYEVLDTKHSVRLSGRLSPPDDGQPELHFALPAASLKRGSYSLIFRGIASTGITEIARIRFTH